MKIIIGYNRDSIIRAAVVDAYAREQDVLDMVREGLIVRMVESDNVTLGAKYETQSKEGVL
jgi:hypothetical protein